MSSNVWKSYYIQEIKKLFSLKFLTLGVVVENEKGYKKELRWFGLSFEVLSLSKTSEHWRNGKSVNIASLANMSGHNQEEKCKLNMYFLVAFIKKQNS